MYIKNKKGKWIKVTTLKEFEERVKIEQLQLQEIQDKQLISSGIGGDTPSTSGSAA